MVHELIPPCEQCTIEIGHSLVLGPDQNAPASIESNFLRSRVIRLGDEYVATGVGLDVLLIYGNDGSYRRTVGRSGPGPGEFQFIRHLYSDQADSLFVFSFDRRLAIFDSNYNFSREVKFEVLPERVVRLHNGSFVVAGPHRTYESAGYPLHYVGADGQLQRSFGTNNPIVDPARPALETRRLARGKAAGMFWSAYTDKYVLEHWSGTTTIRESLVRTVEWFPPHQSGAQASPTERPLPFLRDLVADSNGLLWVLILVADANWTENEGDESDSVFAVLDRRFDSVIEVIDPVDRSVLASRRFDNFVDGFAAAATPYFLRFAEDGDTQVVTWSLQLSLSN